MTDTLPSTADGRFVPELAMMHGRDYEGQNLAGWLLSEKLDGCRGWWTGEQMLTRSGAVIAIPEAMRAALPEGIVLEGEVWAGRGRLAQAMRAVRRGRFDGTESFVIFDAPCVPDLVWPVRLEFAGMVVGKMPAGPVTMSWSRECLHNEDAFDELTDVLAIGGEGLMARAPRSFYRPGRTAELLKLKNPHQFS